MNVKKFKTNIKCAGCVAAVTPYMNDAVGAGNWQVDVQSADKILTAESETATLSDIRQAIEKAGYKAEPLS